MSVKKRSFSGKTISDAVNNGLRELGVSEHDVKITVLAQPSRGILGLFGVKEAKVELEWHEPEETADQPALAAQDTSADVVSQAREYIIEVVAKMGVQAEVTQSADEDGNVLLQFKGREIGLLIGRRGQTLDALQTLVNVFVNRISSDHVRIILDAERFRERRKKTLEDLSMRLANQVIRTKREIVLEPMSAHERRIIHYKLHNHPKVKTFSKGDEPNRRIVITLKS